MGTEMKGPKDRERIESVLKILKKQAPVTVKQWLCQWPRRSKEPTVAGLLLQRRALSTDQHMLASIQLQALT
ncbi:hypothetical protein BHM03_00010170 [Ensete ventricosum]|nr:hypothetical protein BHM03_00010170 [Ensete ventricosum]